VCLVLGERDASAEEFEAPVRADRADDLDTALGRKSLRRSVGDGHGRAEPPGPHLGRGRSAVCAVAVLIVVKLDERRVLGPEMVEAVKDLGSEERLVPYVVEMFDHSVAPRLAQRDESRGGNMTFSWRTAESLKAESRESKT